SDPIAASCHEQWTAITGETVEQNTYDYSLITAMCTYVDEVAAALSIAGGDLNRDTLVAAFESLPPHRVPAVVGEVDWGSGERFGPNSFSVLTYDGASNTVAYDAEGVFEVG
ncbi:MAG: hypothetical protein KDB21_18730, partial [Acidimicrobiales bacterium]|nr:hypothetical protein [Acidimicrobiales bacterium]